MPSLLNDIEKQWDQLMFNYNPRKDDREEFHQAIAYFSLENVRYLIDELKERLEKEEKIR